MTARKDLNLQKYCGTGINEFCETGINESLPQPISAISNSCKCEFVRVDVLSFTRVENVFDSQPMTAGKDLNLQENT